MDEVARTEPELYAAWRAAGEDFRFPGGESLPEQQQRVAAALAECAAAGCPRWSSATAARSADAVRANGRGLGAFHEWEVPNGELIRL